MKKYFTIFFTIALVVAFSACSSKADVSTSLRKEGIAPYELSDRDAYLLQAIGMDTGTNIISFKAPKSVKSIKLNTYVLDDDGTWNPTGGGQVSSGTEANPDARLEGTFTMLLKDDGAIDFIINATGSRAFFQVDALDADDHSMSAKRFLTDFQEIEPNKEIPVAMMVYDSGTSMRGFVVDDYFSPSKFEGMDVVQAVTLTFTDRTV